MQSNKESQNAIFNHAQVYLQRLNNVGFNHLTIGLCTNKNEIIELNAQHKKLSKKAVSFENIYAKENNAPNASLFLNDNQLSIKYTHYFQFNKNQDLYIETGYDLAQLKKSVSVNIPNGLVGFIFAGHDTLTRWFDKTTIRYLLSPSNFPVYYEEPLFGKIIHCLDPETEKRIASYLTDNSRIEAYKLFSFYLSFGKESKAISFKLLENNNKYGKIYLVSLSRDFMLDKTNDWNNQIFLINLTIILLIMIGITYLFINRITLLKQKKHIEESEIKLKEMNQSKDKFFSIIAHDLKNPFNGIIGMTGFLSESYDQIEDIERKEIIEELNIASKNAFNLLQNLLEWTRTQSGTIKNVPVRIEPETIIEIALETVNNIAKNKEIEIIKTIETNKQGFADENLITTVLRNLFTNAVKFSPRKSSIEVIVKQFANELVFCVKDSGIGLRDDEIDQLFRIDVTFHKKGTEEETGTGLGLKLCKEFIEYCHGRIWVVSEPEKGSNFYFTIPLLTT